MNTILRLLLIAFVIGVFNQSQAQISDEMRSWISGVQNQNGATCCSLADGYFLEAVEWEIRGNSYWVFLREDNQWHEVEEWAYIKGPNKARRALVWVWLDDSTEPEKPRWRVKCFAPGELT
mgnify:CR=1 FL=1